MQRVDAGYLYEIGDAVRCVGSFSFRDVPAYEIWGPLVACRQKLTDFLSNSVYSGSLRGVIHPSASAFIAALDALTNRIANEKMDNISALDQMPIRQAYQKFEPIFQAELSSQVLYLVLPKGVYDVIALVENGSQLFPQSVHLKAPEADRDIVDGARGLAFELWTAAAFHFHRANEAVLRRYFDHCVGPNQRPDPCTMGTMLRNMEQRDVGDEQVIVALRSITKFHRNPNAHPGQFIDDAEQAFSLVAALRAAMGYMLDRLPMLPFDELMTASPNPEIAAPPLIASPANP